jgi:transposase
MEHITTIGLDLAKNFIQIHGADAKGKTVLTKRVARKDFFKYMSNMPKCLVGMEACGGSNYIASEMIKQGFDARLMSPRKVKKYVENHKNDARDAAACAEAVGRGSMTFVPIKNQVQMEIQAIHRLRSFYIKQRTAFMNMIRGLLYESGITIPKGKKALINKLRSLIEAGGLQATHPIHCEDNLEKLREWDKEVDRYTSQLKKLAKADELCQQIETIPGIAEITATALIAKIGNGSEFKKGRELSAYLGLVPKQCSSGDKQQLLGISKHGDRYIRQLMIHGGRSCVKAAKRKDKATGLFVKNDAHSQWVRDLAEKRGVNKASVAVANKHARIVIALLKNNVEFQPDKAH